MLNRDLYKDLKKWLTKKDRKPLILKGARQVGKTHLLTTFAKKEFEQVIYLNFELRPELADYFNGNLSPHKIIENISILYEVDITPKTTCLIFDEIQECPQALNSLKYFCESAPEYAILGAGSLLDVKLAKAGFPVGKVDFLNLKPLSFLEYLEATNHLKWRNFLENIKLDTLIPEAIHTDLLREFQFYLFLGGMPAVLMNYLKNQNLEKAREVQLSIINAYQLDFAKHAPPNQVVRIGEVWSSIPAQLAKENKKFIFSVITKSARGRDYDQAIEWLRQAGLITKVKLISTPKIPLSAYANNDVFKVYLLDVGLLGALSNLPSQLVVQPDALFSEFKGALIENLIMQECLVNQTEDLFYWASNGQAEVDLIIPIGLNIYPLEIKSGLTKHKKSLLVYQNKFSPKYILRTNPRGFKLDNNFLNIPLYMIRQGLALLKE